MFRKFFALFLCVMLTGCVYAYMFRPAQVASCYIENKTSLDDAYSKALRITSEMEYTVCGADKASGVFQVNKAVAGGFGETSSISFSFFREDNGQLSFTMKVNSSKDTQEVINDFLNRYKRYYKIKYSDNSNTDKS
jgi:hypothetical protein